MSILRDFVAAVALMFMTVGVLILVLLWFVIITIAYPFVILFGYANKLPSYKEMTFGTFERKKTKNVPASQVTIVVDAPKQ